MRNFKPAQGSSFALLSAAAFQKSNPLFDVGFKFFVAEFRVACLFPDFARNFGTIKAVCITMFSYAAMINCALRSVCVKNNSVTCVAAFAHILAIAF